MKQIIGGVIGAFLGVFVMLLINMIPEPYSNKDMICLANIYIPTIKLVSENAKLELTDVLEKEINLTYSGETVTKEILENYYHLLKKYGYRNLKNNFNDKSKPVEFISVFDKGNNELIYVLCNEKSSGIDIKYSLEAGKIDVFENEKYFVMDERYEYDEVKIDDKVVKVPSFSNVADLKKDESRSFSGYNFINIRYKYEDNTTSEQKDMYFNKYAELLVENGFTRDANTKMLFNDVVEIDVYNDYSFNIEIDKK